MRDYDDILDDIGGFGLYQRLINFIILGLLNYLGTFNVMLVVFIAATPDHWCHTQSAQHLNLSQDVLLNLTIPREVRVDMEEYSQCSRYNVDYTDWTLDDVWKALNNRSTQEATTTCTEGWTYDTSTYTSSVVTEWDLVCGRRYLSAVSSSVYMAGLMVGGSAFGFVSDWYGRKVAWSSSLLLIVVSGIGTAFSPNYWIYTIGRFLMGTGGMGNGLAGFITAVELVSKRWCVFVGVLGNYFWSVFLVILAGITYFIRDWRTLTMVIFLPQILNLIIVFFFPESPRWLYSHNKHEKADRMVRKIARINGVTTLPDKLNVEIKKDPSTGVFLDIFRHKSLRWMTVKICFQWFTCSMVYYGLSLSSSNLGGNPYVNFAIGGALEFLATILSHLTIQLLGRRIVLVGSMLACGAVLLCMPLIPPGLKGVEIGLSMGGRFFIFIAFTTVYIFSAELFPTVIRTVGLSAGSFSARIGGIIAPFLASLIGISRFIPYISFGVLAITAGILGLLLPETKNRKLPEDVNEAAKTIRTNNEEETQEGEIQLEHPVEAQ